jgi:hypothetical protein
MKDYSRSLRRHSIRRVLSKEIQPVTRNDMGILIELIEEYLKSMPKIYRFGVHAILLVHVLIPPIDLRYPKFYSRIPLVSIVSNLVLSVAMLRMFDERDTRLRYNDSH